MSSTTPYRWHNDRSWRHLRRAGDLWFLLPVSLCLLLLQGTGCDQPRQSVPVTPASPSFGPGATATARSSGEGTGLRTDGAAAASRHLLDYPEEFVFVANGGQWRQPARYLLRRRSMNVWFTDDAITYDLHGSNGNGHLLRRRFVGGSGGGLFGEGSRKGARTYISGSGTISASAFSELRNPDIYPGISARYYRQGEALKYDLLVASGADPGVIRFRYEGDDGLRIDPDGSLAVTTSVGVLHEAPPFCYQQIGEARRVVPARFVLDSSGVGFELGAYDHSRGLVIDPTLIYSSYLGGDLADEGRGVAMDASGNIYVTGITRSEDFPTTLGAYSQSLSLGSADAFVTKLDPSGQRIIFSTYIGGSGTDEPAAIRISSGGVAIIAGTTYSSGINDFPVKPSSISSGSRSGYDGFLLALNAGGTGLVYSTYLGGSDEDHIEDLALDSRGQGVVIGWTKSIDFPITQAATIASAKSNGEDAFVAKVNAAGTALVFSTYLGGNGDERGKAVALDPGGAIYVTGWTTSSNFPTTANAYSSVNKGGSDCFVARIRSIEATPSLTLEYSTMIGGRGQDQPSAIAVDSSRNPYITGVTAVLDAPSNDYPVNSSSPQGSWFVTKIGPSGNNLDYSRYLGANDNGGGASIQVDKSGNAYISGKTNSSSFDLTSDAFTGSPRGGFDVAVVKLSPDGGTILHSSVIGGSNDDIPGPHASFLGQRGDLLVTGTTISRDFPTSRLSLDRTLNDTGNVNQSDAFLMRFEFDRRPFAIAPTTRQFSPLRCDSVRLDTFYLYNTGDDTLKVTANVIVPQTLPFQIDSPATNLLPLRIKPGDSLRYIVRLTLKNPNTVTDTLLIYANSLLGKDSLPVVLTGTRIDPGLEVAPARILFPNTLSCNASGRDTTLTIRGKSSDTATVTSIRLAVDGGGPFSLPALPALPKSLTSTSVSLGLTLRFRPTRAGTFRDTLLVSIAECDQPTRIPIEGTRDSVDFYVDPADVTFPPLIACRGAVDTVVTLINSGSVPIVIDSSRVIFGSGFTVVEPLPLTIPVFSSRQLRLRFDPGLAVGAFGASVSLWASPCGLVRPLGLHGIRLLADSLQSSLEMLDFGTLNGCIGQPAGRDSTIVLRNRGFDTLVVESPLVAVPFSITTPGLFPLRLLPGDSLSFAVHYAPPVRGSHTGLLLIPYQSGNCNDTLEIAITGRRDDPLLELSRSSIEIGTLTDCESGRNDSVTIYNRSGVPAAVDSVRASDGVVLLRPTIPFSIPPGDSLTLYVHFQPRQAGESNEQLTLFSGPCGDSLTITLHGIKQGIVLGFEQSSLQFGSRLQCLLPLQDTLLATILNTGSGGVKARVISARVIGDQVFTIDGVDNREIPSGGSASVPVVFSPGSVGEFSATLEVILSPCNDTLRLPLGGSVVETKLGVEGGSFGELPVGESADTFVVIRNGLPVPVTVDTITNIVAPFSLDSSVPRLPALLNPGDSLVVMLRFSPTAAGTYQPTPVASVSSSCPFTVTLPLSGRGIGGGDSIGFCVSGSYQGLVGDTVTIPIDATISGPLKTPGDIRYHIRYDQQRLQLLDVVSSQTLDQAPGITPDDLLLIAHGIAELHPRQFLLRFRLLAGPDTSVIVRLDSAFVVGGMAAEICQDSARVQITARCILTGVTIGKYHNLLKPATPNPAGSTVEVTYQQLEDARAILRIWDLEGREVLRPLDAYLPGGRYTVRFSISELPSGRYFYEIQAGQYRESLGLVIQR